MLACRPTSEPPHRHPDQCGLLSQGPLSHQTATWSHASCQVSVGRPNSGKIQILPSLLCRLSAILNKVSILYLAKCDLDVYLK